MINSIDENSNSNCNDLKARSSIISNIPSTRYNLNHVGAVPDELILSADIIKNIYNTSTENLLSETPQPQVIPLISEYKSSLKIKPSAKIVT